MRILFVLALLWGPAPAAAKEKTVSQDQQWKGQFCGLSKPSTRVAKNPKEWAALWKDIGRPAPDVDLKGKQAVAVFLGQQPTGGFRVHFLEPVESKSRLLVPYQVLPPKGMALQAFTQPYGVRLIPLPPYELNVDIQERK